PFPQQYGPQQNAAGYDDNAKTPRRAGYIFVYLFQSPGKKKKVNTNPQIRYISNRMKKTVTIAWNIALCFYK
ncbi:MAG: hypothetical protein ICV53_01450, partial [Flavisolibacter sp.]|nr:hypothetical protein [Flavisolibacter sp.]